LVFRAVLLAYSYRATPFSPSDAPLGLVSTVGRAFSRTAGWLLRGRTCVLLQAILYAPVCPGALVAARTPVASALLALGGYCLILRVAIPSVAPFLPPPSLGRRFA